MADDATARIPNGIDVLLQLPQCSKRTTATIVPAEYLQCRPFLEIFKCPTNVRSKLQLVMQRGIVQPSEAGGRKFFVLPKFAELSFCSEMQANIDASSDSFGSFHDVCLRLHFLAVHDHFGHGDSVIDDPKIMAFTMIEFRQNQEFDARLDRPPATATPTLTTSPAAVMVNTGPVSVSDSQSHVTTTAFVPGSFEAFLDSVRQSHDAEVVVRLTTAYAEVDKQRASVVMARLTVRG